MLLFSSCKTQKEMVEAKSFKDGYFKYYYIKKTDSYAIVGDGDVPYPETLVIPAYYNGKEITDVYYHVNTALLGGSKYLGPSLLGVETVWFPYTSNDFFSFVENYYNLLSVYGDDQLSSPQKYFMICNSHITYLSSAPKEEVIQKYYIIHQYFIRNRFIALLINMIMYVSGIAARGDTKLLILPICLTMKKRRTTDISLSMILKEAD